MFLVYKLLKGDCLEQMKELPDNSVDLVLTDPPYNIAIAEWDKIENYIQWCEQWMRECHRVLKSNGVMYFFHNDMPQIAQLMEMIRQNGLFSFVSFCIWDKGEAYRALSWKQRDPDGETTLRSWFNRCEYCLEYHVSASGRCGSDLTGTQRIHSNAQCFSSIKEWYKAKRDELGLTDKHVAEFYTNVTGRKPHMLRHYFQDSQFSIPTKMVWDNVYVPLGFDREYEDLRKEYEDLRKEYEDLRKEYEDLRPYHRCDDNHHNVWSRDVLNAAHKVTGHPCEKPVDILERIVTVSSKPGATVLDLFMGGGSTGVACANTGRRFIGIEMDDTYFSKASERISDAFHVMRGDDE